MSNLPLDSQRFDLHTGTCDGRAGSERRLSDLRGFFVDSDAFDQLITSANPVLYTVTGNETAQGEGQLHYGVGVLMPGKVGAEYFMTKGHFHAWRPAAEVYTGLSGHGLMLLEHEQTGEERLLPLDAGCVVYVPGYTAHRTINVGNEPLVYIGIYPSAAGHDYGAIAERNFRSVVVDIGGVPTRMDRESYLHLLHEKSK